MSNQIWAQGRLKIITAKCFNRAGVFGIVKNEPPRFLLLFQRTSRLTCASSGKNFGGPSRRSEVNKTTGKFSFPQPIGPNTGKNNGFPFLDILIKIKLPWQLRCPQTEQKIQQSLIFSSRAYALVLGFPCSNFAKKNKRLLAVYNQLISAKSSTTSRSCDQC